MNLRVVQHTVAQHGSQAAPVRVPLLPMEQVLHRVPIGKTLFYELIKEGKFPKGVQLTRRLVVWPANVVDQWIDDRLHGRGVL